MALSLLFARIPRCVLLACAAMSACAAYPAATASADFQTTTIDNLQGFREPGFTGRVADTGPVDLVVGPDATMWMLDANGSLWHLVGSRLRRVTRPTDSVSRRIAVDGWGRIALLVHDRRGRVVLRRIYPDGRHDDVAIGPGDPDPNADMVAGPGGTVWFYLLSGGGWVGVTPNARVHNVKLPRNYPGGAVAYPFTPTYGPSLDVGADGNLWFDDALSVGSFTPAGKFLPPMRLEPDRSGSVVLHVGRGSDDAMWVGVAGSDYLARIDPKTHVVTKYLYFGQLIDTDFNRVFWALAPGPGASIWPLTGYDAVSQIEILASDSIDPFGPNGRLTDTIEFLPPVRSNVSAEHFGLVAGLDGRMWFTERLLGKLEAWRSPWWQPSPRGRARVLGVHRVGRWARVDLGCTGTTGGYCTGSLQLRANGRLIGRPARYAVAAGPAAVKSRSARWLPIPRADRARGMRLTVQRHRVPGL